MQENILLFCHVAFESDIKIICDDGYRSAARPKWCWLMEGHIPDSQVKLSEGSPTLIRLDVAGEKKSPYFLRYLGLCMCLLSLLSQEVLCSL